MNDILENPKVTQAELAKKLNISISTVKKNMKQLVNHGILERIGGNKCGYWKIKGDLEKFM